MHYYRRIQTAGPIFLNETPCQGALLKALVGPARSSSILSGCCAEYIGCFKPRDNADNRLRLRTHRWYDPHHELFEGDSSRYAEGPFYVIQGSVIDGLVRSGLTVRMGGPNEGKLTLRLKTLESQLDAAAWRQPGLADIFPGWRNNAIQLCRHMHQVTCCCMFTILLGICL